MINRILGGLGRILIFSGVVLLLFVGYQLWGTKLDEQGHQDDLAKSFSASVTEATAANGSTGDNDAGDNDAATIDEQVTAELASLDPQTAPPVTAPPEGESAGLIEIPKIGLKSKHFVEGVAKADLRKGPGHYAGTPMPGNPGNAAIAGHRSTYGAPFNRIDELVPGDTIITYTLQGKFVYEVMVSPENRRQGKENGNWGQGWFAVNPSDVSVLDPSTENILTLTACHPKYSAKLRIIVQAKLIAEPAVAAPPTTVDATPAASEDDENSQTVSGPATAVTEEDMIAGDSTELTPSLLFGALVIGLWLAAMGAAALLRRRSVRFWPVYVVVTLASAAPLWFCFVHMDRFLPSY